MSMTDRNGKSISIGARVKAADGSISRVSGLITVKATVHKASEVEVVSEDHQHQDSATHSKAADGDSIIWGS